MITKHLTLLSSLVLVQWCVFPQESKSLPENTILEIKVQQVAKICDSLAKIDEVYKERIVAKKALSMVQPNGHKHLALLYFYIAYTFENTAHDSAVYYYEKSLAEARTSANTLRILEAANRLVPLYNSNEMYFRKRESLIDYLITVSGDLSDKRTKAGLYGTMAGYYNTRGLYEKEINYKLLSLSIKKEMLLSGKSSSVDTSNLGVAYLSIGESYLGLRNPDKAMEYVLPSKAYFKNYRNGMCYYFKAMADIYIEQPDLAKAHVYYDSLKSFLVTKSSPMDDWGTLIAINLSFSDYYLAKGNADQASLYLKKGVELLKNHPNVCIERQADYITGKIGMATKNYKSALISFNNAATRNECLGPEIYADLLKSEAECYSSLKEYKNAALAYNKYIPLRDSLYKEAAKQSIANAEAKYQNKEKQRQIERQQAQISLEKKQKTLYFSGLLLLMIISILLVIIYRNKKRTAKILLTKNRDLEHLNKELHEANASKAKLFSIISHDLRSPVSQVYQFLKLHEHPEILNETEKKQLSSEVQQATKALLETMEDLLLWSKTQLNLFEPQIQPVNVYEVVMQGVALQKLNAEAKSIVVNVHVNPNERVMADPDYLQIIFRNVLHNAIKASLHATPITISYNAHQLTLTVDNTGKPFDQSDYEQTIRTTGLSGLGLKLVSELSTKICIGVLFEALNEEGTRVNLMFKSA